MKARQYLLLVMFLMLSGFLCGAAASRFMKPQPAVAEESEITTEQVQIYDAKGEIRMLLSTDEDDLSPSISLFDANGNPRTIYSLTGSGEPLLSFYDKKGKVRLIFSWMEGDGSEITCYDKNEKAIWTAH